MTKTMLIDASHPEETRVVVSDAGKLLDFDYESTTKRQIKGNVYLAKITRVEPSLQAAFVEYGGNRHGFLAFSEIHPDYYQIPQADRELIDGPEEADDAEGESEEENHSPVPASEEEETADVVDQQARKRARLLRSYKIQEVVKRRQIMLVQVVKEERGNKGAALTTYLSLAGRYCVLMPNTPRGGGISRKIANPNDRRRLKSIAEELEVPQGMGLIIRTAGEQRNKSEIKRDYDYLLRLWEQIRGNTLESIAPALIYEEGNLVKRALRDLYSRDIEEVMVEGEDTYKGAKKLMTMLMPSRARTVKQYKGELPLFVESGIEEQLDNMFTPTVNLPSGGSIVIHVTEALTAIDVNSGKATRERHIDETAVKTNLEAADAIARHLRLRDIAGLIVIDFIDMSENKHQRHVERRLREALKNDRARLQVGKISMFGLLEMSRQRLRPSLQELSSHSCPHCNGQGTVRSVESCALQALRRIQDVGIKDDTAVLDVRLPINVAMYLVNEKRDLLVRLEQRFSMRVNVLADDKLLVPAMQFDTVERRERDGEDDVDTEQPTTEKRVDERKSNRRRRARGDDTSPAESGAEEGEGKKRRRRRRRRRKGDHEEQPGSALDHQDTAQSVVEEGQSAVQASSDDADQDGTKPAEVEAIEVSIDPAESDQPAIKPEGPEFGPASTAEPQAEAPAKPKRRRRTPKAEATATDPADGDAVPPKPKRRRTRRPKSETAAAEAPVAVAAPEEVEELVKAIDAIDEEPSTVSSPAAEEPMPETHEEVATASEEASPGTSEETLPATAATGLVNGNAGEAMTSEPAKDSNHVAETTDADDVPQDVPIESDEPAKPAKVGWWNRFVR